MTVSRETPIRIFVTGTGTEVGKTYVASSIAAAAHQLGHKVAALKPIETGCTKRAEDAVQLATAAGTADLANISGFYRAKPPLSPLAAELHDGTPSPKAQELAALVKRVAEHYPCCIVEGAGGFLVPINHQETIADIAKSLEYKVVIAARNRLGVQSDTLQTVEAIRSRDLEVAAVVLTPTAAPPLDRFSQPTPSEVGPQRSPSSIPSSLYHRSASPPAPSSEASSRDSDISLDTNLAVLRTLLPEVPVLQMQPIKLNPQSLATEARRMGLHKLLLK